MHGGRPVRLHAAALDVAELLELSEEMVQRLLRHAEPLRQSDWADAIARRLLEQPDIGLIDTLGTALRQCREQTAARLLMCHSEQGADIRRVLVSGNLFQAGA